LFFLACQPSFSFSIEGERKGKKKKKEQKKKKKKVTGSWIKEMTSFEV